MDIGFFEVRKRICAYVLMASLLALHMYLAFSAHQQMRIGTLRSMDYSVIQAMERTCENALLPSRSDRVRFLTFFEMFSAQSDPFVHAYAKMDFTAKRRLFDIWSLLVGRASTLPPHSEMVLRI